MATTTSKGFSRAQFPVHLGAVARIDRLPEFTGDMAWYQAYDARFAQLDGGGRLVSMHGFRESWTSWEMHPHGEELVLCTAGTITIWQQTADGNQAVVLQPGDAVINPAGVWRTADVAAPATAAFFYGRRGSRTSAALVRATQHRLD
ncbi:MAG: cupin domain-containing protein [Kofleriaceae bacterium]|nr:cupin domain-containing protein [Kofleriaceae bacterium]